MKAIFSLIFILVFSIQNVAQNSNTLQLNGKHLSKEDTLRALTNFNHRIHRNLKIATIAVISGLSAEIINISTSTSKQNSLQAFATGALTGSLIGNLILWKRFNRKNFAKIVNDYNTKGILPYSIRSRLKEKDFKFN